MKTDYTLLINQEHPLPENFVPNTLIDAGIPFDASPGDPKRLLEEKAACAAMALINRSVQEGLHLIGVSGYRSYKRQKELYTGNPYIAAPGTSEHQSGLAIDLSCPRIGLKLTEDFADTPEGCWLARHASLYGFILRYPQNKESITKVPYEPWHIRYVTKSLASYLTLTGMTLEEYHTLEDNIETAL